MFNSTCFFFFSFFSLFVTYYSPSSNHFSFHPYPYPCPPPPFPPNHPIPLGMIHMERNSSVPRPSFPFLLSLSLSLSLSLFIQTCVYHICNIYKYIVTGCKLDWGFKLPHLFLQNFSFFLLACF